MNMERNILLGGCTNELLQASFEFLPHYILYIFLVHIIEHLCIKHTGPTV